MVCPLIQSGFNPRSRTGSDRSHQRVRAVSRCFNPRSRTGSDAALLQLSTCQYGFNPRSRTGSDDADRRKAREKGVLQSTLPHGERLQPWGAPIIHSMLQSTLPHGERLSFLQFFDRKAPLQSTLPHGERQAGGNEQRGLVGASIHAPARGATWGKKFTLKQVTGLQSTLPHGERLGGIMPTACSMLLQSTLPHGERLRDLAQERGRENASIHAPARGATFCVSSTSSRQECFNPRSRTGSD